VKKSKVRITAELSKMVGWEKRSIMWPKKEAIKNASDFDILTWYRFLPPAENKTERETLEELMLRIGGIKRNVDRSK